MFDMLSVPPARTTSASPSRIVRAAESIACRPEPQAWLTVKAGRSTGTPARKAIWRARVRAAAGLAGVAEDHLVDHAGAGGDAGARAGRPVPRACRGRPRRARRAPPPNLPIGVRTGATSAKRCLARRVPPASPVVITWR